MLCEVSILFIAKIVKNLIVEGKHHKPIVTDVFYQENQQPKKVVIFCHGYNDLKVNLTQTQWHFNYFKMKKKFIYKLQLFS